jgi:hypothetical protein
MSSIARILAMVVAASIVPSPAFAAPSLAQQMRALQQQLQQLEKKSARDERRIKQLERSGHVSEPRAVPAFSVNSAPVTQPHVVEAAAIAPAPIAPAPEVPHATYGATAPPAAAVKAVYQQQNALFNKGLTLTPSAAYTYGDNRFFTLNGFMALGAIFLGNIDVSRQQSSVYEPNLNVAYAVSNRLQFDATVPFVYRSSTFSSQGAQSSTAQTSARTVNSGALGDINAGLYYELPRSSLGGPATVLSAHVTMPTGVSPYGIKVYQDSFNNNLSYVNSLPTGQGAWGVQVGATMIKTLDPAVVFGGVTLGYNFAGHYRDISPYDGTTQPGSVQPGSSLSFDAGTAFSLNDRLSTSFSFQDSVVGSLRERPDGQPWSSVVGSALNAAVFNIGATYAVSKDVSYQVVLGIGVTQDAPNFQVNLRVPHFIP